VLIMEGGHPDEGHEEIEERAVPRINLGPPITITSPTHSDLSLPLHSLYNPQHPTSTSSRPLPEEPPQQLPSSSSVVPPTRRLSKDRSSHVSEVEAGPSTIRETRHIRKTQDSLEVPIRTHRRSSLPPQAPRRSSSLRSNESDTPTKGSLARDHMVETGSADVASAGTGKQMGAYDRFGNDTGGCEVVEKGAKGDEVINEKQERAVHELPPGRGVMPSQRNELLNLPPPPPFHLIVKNLGVGIPKNNVSSYVGLKFRRICTVFILITIADLCGRWLPKRFHKKEDTGVEDSEVPKRRKKYILNEVGCECHSGEVLAM
jgi:hypothetical protein